MYHILFICTANICRTPMAEYYLKSVLKEKGLSDNIKVESAGTWGADGSAAAPLSIAVCREKGLDATNHRARSINVTIMNRADLVLCMTSEQKNDLSQIFPHYENKISTLKEYQNYLPLQTESIADPYGKKIDHYRETFRIIRREVRRILPFIEEKVNSKVPN